MALDSIARGIAVLVEKRSPTPSQRRGFCRKPCIAPACRYWSAIIAAIIPSSRPRGKRSWAAKLGQLTAVAGLWLLKKPDDYLRSPGGANRAADPLLINLIHDIDNLRFILRRDRRSAGDDIEQAPRLCGRRHRGIAFEICQWRAWHLHALRCHAGAVELGIIFGRERGLPSAGSALYLFAGTKGSLAVPNMALWTYPGRRWMVRAR